MKYKIWDTCNSDFCCQELQQQFLFPSLPTRSLLMMWWCDNGDVETDWGYGNNVTSVKLSLKITFSCLCDWCIPFIHHVHIWSFFFLSACPPFIKGVQREITELKMLNLWRLFSILSRIFLTWVKVYIIDTHVSYKTLSIYVKYKYKIQISI